MKFRCAFCVALTFLLCGCAARSAASRPADSRSVGLEPAASAPAESTTAVSEPVAEETVPVQDPAAELLATLSTREKVGQLFFIRPDSLNAALTQKEINDSKADGVKTITAPELELLSQYPVGGFCIFGKNISDPDQLYALQQALISGCSITPVFTVDEEGGPVSRLAKNEKFNLPVFDSAADIAATGDASLARDEGYTIGSYLKKYGFSLNFAPVADVNTNPDNPVIGVRAYGDDPDIAAEMVSAAVDGYHQAGIGCTLKHFPGHGDTSTDTHTEGAVAEKSWEEMLSCEMVAFRAGIAAGADAVMVAHISTPNATQDGLPATLSYQMITGKLRGELGFNGLVITDSLAMDAISKFYSPGEAAVMALNAGADVVLMPNDFTETFDAVVAAVESGTVTEKQLNSSVYRILKYKENYGLL